MNTCLKLAGARADRLWLCADICCGTSRRRPHPAPADQNFNIHANLKAKIFGGLSTTLFRGQPPPTENMSQCGKKAARAETSPVPHQIGRPREEHGSLLLGRFDAERAIAWCVSPVPLLAE